MTENPSEWTPLIVRDYILAIIQANDKRYEERATTQERAVTR